jgi:spermidine synthase
MSLAAPSAAILRGDLFFTAGPGSVAELPRPFQVAGRLPRLLDEERPTVAILGLGLGAVAALMIEQRPGMRLIGVEPDEALAGSIGEPLRSRIELERTDALTFLHRTRKRLDLVFDDCFVLEGEDAVRPPELTRHADLVARRLSAGGVYVRNLLPIDGRPIAEQCADVRQRFSHVELRSFREWENRFVIAADRPLPGGWRTRLG